MFDRLYDINPNIDVVNLMITFAKLKVTEALFETSELFKNPKNVSYIKNHYNLDKIV